jgi:hypothetical protein
MNMKVILPGYSLIICNSMNHILFLSLSGFKMEKLSVVVPIFKPLSLRSLSPPNFLLQHCFSEKLLCLLNLTNNICIGDLILQISQPPLQLPNSARDFTKFVESPGIKLMKNCLGFLNAITCSTRPDSLYNVETLIIMAPNFFKFGNLLLKNAFRPARILILKLK